MKKLYFLLAALLLVSGLGINHWMNSSETENLAKISNKIIKPPKQVRIAEIMEWERQKRIDPALGYVPHERMLDVYRRIEELTASNAARSGTLPTANWRDRGPYDVGGRTRGMLIDKGDPTGNTVFTAGVTGGLWKTTNISSSNPNWQDIGHFYANINISALGQSTTNPDIIYFGTGEPHGGAGQGLGIWKSTDGGDNFTQLPATLGGNFTIVVRIFVHPTTDHVYAATQTGLRKSKDGGATWTKVLGSGVFPGVSNGITDIEFAKDGAIYISDGHTSGTSNIYRSDAGPNQGDAANWQRLTISNSGFPGGRTRVELAVAPSNENVIYAQTAVGGNGGSIYKSTNRGVNWSKTSDAPGAIGMDNFTRGQAGYDLEISVNPADENMVIIGGIDLLRSTNGGISWVQISQWFGGAGLPYVHADQHSIVWDKDRPSRVLFGNDGGIWLSQNGSSSINPRNRGYNVTQFYAHAMHPDAFSNYFLAGAQDNGTQQFDSYNIATTNEVLGGDGFMCHIDQNQPDTQLASLYYGDFFLSVNGGESFGRLFAYENPPAGSGPGTHGIRVGNARSGFFTPSDFDNDANILYAQAAFSGSYFRWAVSEGGGFNLGNPATSAANAVGTTVNISGFSSFISHVYASDNVANRIYVGSSSGRISKIDNAHVGTSVTGTNINLPGGGTISCIQEEDGNADHLIATVSNYGLTSVWESTNGGTNWINIEGDLPDLPVNWAAFHPYDSDQLLLATDAGIWVTENIDAANTNWLISINMPVVRTDMLQIRKSDGLISAGTYGRGIFSTAFLSPSIPNLRLNQAAYLNGPVNFTDFSINAQTWAWDFGNGATSTLQTPNYTYSAIGSYDVTLTINDTATTNIETVKVLPDEPVPYIIGGTNYGGSFESNDEDFGVHHVSGTRWEKGSSIIPYKDGSVSGGNAWVTGLTNSFYANNTETYLYTPNFDLSDNAIYEVKFSAKFNIQDGFDGFMVEYTTDRGASWNQLGGHNEDIEDELNKWYNYTSASNQTAFPRNSSYFTGFQPSWKEFKTDLNALTGQSSVAFRFVFKSNGLNRRAGVAIDDFQVTKYDDILATVLRSFTGKFTTPNGNEIALEWTTQPEYRCSHFKIYESENGQDYIEYLDEVQAQGSTADATAYPYRKSDKNKDLYFYYIKVFDLDGNSFNSDVVVISRDGEDPPFDIAKLYPVPFNNYLNISFNKHIDEQIVVNIYDASGKLVISEARVPNNVFLTINTQVLQAGVYVLVAQYGEDQVVKKILKNK